MSARTALRPLLRSVTPTVAPTATRSLHISAPSAVRAVQPAFAPLARPAVAAVQQKRWKSVERSQWAQKPTIDFHELKPLVDQPRPDITLIDVREPEEFNEGHIPSSVNVPLSQLTDAFSEKLNEGTFQQRYSFDRPLPASQLIVYCRSGKRSATAAEELEKRGYRNVRNYQGSWLDWEARRKEKAQGESKWDDDD